MRKNLRLWIIIILSVFLTACGKPEPIVLESQKDVELASLIKLDVGVEGEIDNIESFILTLNGEKVNTEYKVVNNIIQFKAQNNFKANSDYLLTISFKQNKTYLFNFSTMSKLQQTMLKLEKNFFIMPIYDDYDLDEAQKMKARILSISPKILMSLYSANVKMKLTNGPITDEPELMYLKGTIPRGWEGTGLTWDDVPGAGGYNLPIARIGYSEPSILNNHDTINLELHEIAHTVDNYITGKVEKPISFSNEFIEIWESEVEQVLSYDYFITYPEEYFAETFAMYYLDKDSNNQLKEFAPKTFNYIKDLDRLTGIKDFD